MISSLRKTINLSNIKEISKSCLIDHPFKIIIASIIFSAISFIICYKKLPSALSNIRKTREEIEDLKTLNKELETENRFLRLDRLHLDEELSSINSKNEELQELEDDKYMLEESKRDYTSDIELFKKEIISRDEDLESITSETMKQKQTLNSLNSQLIKIDKEVRDKELKLSKAKES